MRASILFLFRVLLVFEDSGRSFNPLIIKKDRTSLPLVRTLDPPVPFQLVTRLAQGDTQAPNSADQLKRTHQRIRSLQKS